jgi:hypothetical protein
MIPLLIFQIQLKHKVKDQMIIYRKLSEKFHLVAKSTRPTIRPVKFIKMRYDVQDIIFQVQSCAILSRWKREETHSIISTPTAGNRRCAFAQRRVMRGYKK